MWASMPEDSHFHTRRGNVIYLYSTSGPYTECGACYVLHVRERRRDVKSIDTTQASQIEFSSENIDW
jgi:hypothetical protein